MSVAELGSADGMLFVFDATADWRFYMWQTLIPLSIASFSRGRDVRRRRRDDPVHQRRRVGVRSLLAGYAVSLCGRTAVGRGGAVGALTAGDRMTVLGPSWWQATALAAG